MIACPSCSRAAPDDSQYCSGCGARLPISGEAATLSHEGPASTPAPRAATPNAAWLSSDSSLDGRFAPGTVFAGRYRIVGRIGKGGMGEVVRADDLRLGQPVALKFLPVEVAQNADRLARFLSEVRIARQVSHPNVCRVYDADHSEGLHYLSMEYIDGEDLASLLRRIGRLPKDKALEIARQICAGLAAIHERGVLHRDLKPANIMLDGRGVARITDFGLAAVASADGAAAGRAGTPAYMAPEQLAGGEATARSDVHALGLVLYELFTGKPVFTGKTLDELIVAKLRAAPRPPSELVADVDPAVEAVLLRCLEKDPLKRPPSALAVSLALPGGDPLAAALLAGETPSPELVAAAGSEGALKPRAAMGLLALLAAALATLVATAPATRLLDVARVETSPQVLQDRAQSMLRDLGYAERPADTAWWFSTNDAYLRHVRVSDASTSRWDSLQTHRPAAVRFCYRQASQHLAAENALGEVRFNDPPHTAPGDIQVSTDPSGRLLLLSAIPPARADAGTSGTGDADAGDRLAERPAERATERAPAPPDWARGFAVAGLPQDSFQPAPPQFTPGTFCETRAAWTGTYRGRADLPVRVEMGAFAGRINWLRIVEPWEEGTADAALRLGPTRRAANTLTIAIVALCLAGAVLLARRNVRLGRGDRRGATRVAWAVFAMFMVRLVLQADHVPSLAREWYRFQVSCGLALFVGAFLYVIYLGLEPYIRKLWPQTLISWSRLLTGRPRDARVGRDVLIGLAVGALVALSAPVFLELVRHAGHAPPPPLAADTEVLRGLRGAIAQLMIGTVNAVSVPLAVLLFMVLMKALLGRQTSAVLATGLLFVVIATLGQPTVEEAIGGALGVVVMLVLLLRLGALAAIASEVAQVLLGNAPITAHLGAWYAPQALLVMVMIAGVALFAFRASLAGQALLGDFAPARSDRAQP